MRANLEGQEEQEARKYFNCADCEGGRPDQTLSANEIQRFLSDTIKCAVPLHFAKMVLRVFDTNGSGKLDFTEFIHLFRFLKHLDTQVNVVCVPARKRAGKLDGGHIPGFGVLYMTREELREYLTASLPSLDPKIVDLLVEYAHYEQVPLASQAAWGGGGAAAAAAASWIVSAPASSWIGPVPAGIPNLPAFQPKPFQAGGGGAGAVAAPPAASFAWPAETQEILPFLGMLRVACQVWAAKLLEGRTTLTSNELWVIATFF
jgi:hypothetical protein